MGAITSQLFAAHLYLQAFDHHVKRVLRVPVYLRYVDDMFLFGQSRDEVVAWRGAASDYLERHLRLRLKSPSAPVLSCRGHLDALGMRIRRERIEPLPVTWRRLRGRLGRYLRGLDRGDRERLERSVAAAMGHAFFG